MSGPPAQQRAQQPTPQPTQQPTQQPRRPPVQQPPPVQRLRIRYAKRGRLRFTSHRDIGRAFERAVRRAGLPVAYSSGFNPHPRLSYAGAAPTGAASEAEYLELALAAECDPDSAKAALDAALPPGLDVLEAVPARSGALAGRLEASRWTIRLPGVPADEAWRAVTAFLGADFVQVARMTKRGLRTFDARAAVSALVVDPVIGGGVGSEPPCAILGLVVRHGEPSVRPDDVLAGLREIAGLEPSTAPVMCRLAQGPLDPRDGTVGDPLAPDRDTHGR